MVQFGFPKNILVYPIAEYVPIRNINLPLSFLSCVCVVFGIGKPFLSRKIKGISDRLTIERIFQFPLVLNFGANFNPIASKALKASTQLSRKAYRRTTTNQNNSWLILVALPPWRIRRTWLLLRKDVRSHRKLQPVMTTRSRSRVTSRIRNGMLVALSSPCWSCPDSLFSQGLWLVPRAERRKVQAWVPEDPVRRGPGDHW